jgi:hypothetical protein
VVTEGRYGFTLVARSEANLGDPTPKVGDAPQQWIEVDVTPPSVELLAPEVMTAGGPGRSIKLRWKAADRNLTDTPISMYWAEKKDGPWVAVHTYLPNTGEHAWIPTGKLPARAYLRLTVRDRAGNVSEAQTPQAVVVDTSLPRATIRKVEVERADGPKPAAGALKVPAPEDEPPPVVSPVD